MYGSEWMLVTVTEGEGVTAFVNAGGRRMDNGADLRGMCGRGADGRWFRDEYGRRLELRADGLAGLEVWFVACG